MHYKTLLYEAKQSWGLSSVVKFEIPHRKREVRGLFGTGDGQTTGRRKGQSLFKDITGGKRKIATKEKEKGEGWVWVFGVIKWSNKWEKRFDHYLCEQLQLVMGCVWGPQPWPNTGLNANTNTHIVQRFSKYTLYATCWLQFTFSTRRNLISFTRKKCFNLWLQRRNWTFHEAIWAREFVPGISSSQARGELSKKSLEHCGKNIMEPSEHCGNGAHSWRGSNNQICSLASHSLHNLITVSAVGWSQTATNSLNFRLAAVLEQKRPPRSHPVL